MIEIILHDVNMQFALMDLPAKMQKMLLPSTSSSPAFTWPATPATNRAPP
jgi:hypothetical protein